jgi:uncharacterized protein
VLLGAGLVWAVVVPVGLLALQITHGPVIADQAELSDVVPPWSLLTELFVWGAYPGAVWFAYVLVGLGVGRLDLRRVATAVRVAALGALLSAGSLTIGAIAIARGWTGLDDALGWRQLFVMTSYPYEPAQWRDLWLVGEHTSRPLNVVGATGSALLVIGLCALVVHVPWSRVVLLPLRAAGTMTLTLYTVHVLWTWRLQVHARDGGAFGPVAASYRDWLLQVVVLCAAATVWHRFVGRGPLEHVMRAVTSLGRRGETKKRPGLRPGR